MPIAETITINTIKIVADVSKIIHILTASYTKPSESQIQSEKGNEGRTRESIWN